MNANFMALNGSEYANEQGKFICKFMQTPPINLNKFDE